ncbi:MAG: hypothetical protein ACRDPK_07135 [Carbonactinosporaceae bacterium]
MSLALDGDTFTPTGVLSGSVSWEARRGCEIVGGLVYPRVTLSEMRSGGPSGASQMIKDFVVTSLGVAELEDAPKHGVSFMEARRYEEGERGSAPLRFLVEGAFPTMGKGFIEITYVLHASVEVERAPDVTEKLTFRVLLPRGAYRDVESRELRVTGREGDCELDILVPRRHMRPGESMTATAVVRPLRDFTAKVGANLLESHVSSRPGTRSKSEQTGRFYDHISYKDVEFTKGKAQRFPFIVRIPTDARPTCYTPSAANRWLAQCGLVPSDMKGWLNKNTPEAELEINVYNG